MLCCSGDWDGTKFDLESVIANEWTPTPSVGIEEEENWKEKGARASQL